MNDARSPATAVHRAVRIALPPLADLPLVSVVVPAYNAGPYLGEALESLAASTYGAWHCVVVDDGSTDDTYTVAAAHAAGDPRVEVVSKANGGPLSCLNTAAPLVRGDVVCLLDADDVVMPTKFAEVVGALRAHPEAGFLVHRLAVADRSLRLVGISPTRRSLPQGDLSETVLRSRHGVPGLGVTSGFCLRAEVFERLFPAGFTTRRFPDEYIRTCAPLVTDICALDEVLGIRRLHGENLTGARPAGDEVAIVRGAARDYAQLSAALTSFAARHGYGDRLVPEAEDVDLLYLSWHAARLAGDPGWRLAWRRLTGARGYVVLPRAVRLYWRLACHAPLPLFRWMMAAATPSDRLRVLVNYLAMVRRPDPGGALRNRAPLGVALRLALGRPERQMHKQ